MWNLVQILEIDRPAVPRAADGSRGPAPPAFMMSGKARKARIRMSELEIQLSGTPFAECYAGRDIPTVLDTFSGAHRWNCNRGMLSKQKWTNLAKISTPWWILSGEHPF